MDPQVAYLVGQELNLDQQIAVSQRRFGRNHRTTQNLQTQLDVVRGDLTPLREQKLIEFIDLRREQIRTAYLTQQGALQTALDELMMAEAEQKDQDGKLANYLDLVQELDWMREQSQELNSFILDLDRVVRSRNAIQISVAKRAVDPLQKSAPAVLLLPAGVVFSGMLAMGVAVALSLLDTSVRTPQDIIRHINIPLLGSVPDLDDEEVDIKCIETAVLDAPHSMVVEAFRTIRTNLQFSGPADRQRSVLVTSPSPEDGKTTVACNLAASVALGGRRVLLVDANLRRPALQNFHANVDGSNGLSNMLVGNADLSSVIKKTSLPNLDVIGSGPMPPNPAELLGSAQMRSFLQEVSSTYDQIFFDADRAAQVLGIDTWDFQWDRLRQSPLDAIRWYNAMRRCDDESIGDVLAFAEEQLPIDQISKGSADEIGIGPEWRPHSCLDFVIQGLDRFPGQGARLIEAGLQSPVIRNRNTALRVLSEWGGEKWPETMQRMLHQALDIEPVDDVRERIRKVIAGDEWE